MFDKMMNSLNDMLWRDFVKDVKTGQNKYPICAGSGIIDARPYDDKRQSTNIEVKDIEDLPCYN